MCHKDNTFLPISDHFHHLLFITSHSNTKTKQYNHNLKIHIKNITNIKKRKKGSVLFVRFSPIFGKRGRFFLSDFWIF